jgi:hypothetical protein
MLIFRSQQHPFTQDIYALAKWFHHRQAFFLPHILLAIASMGSLIESPFKIPIPIGDRWIALRYFQDRTHRLLEGLQSFDLFSSLYSGQSSQYCFCGSYVFLWLWIKIFYDFHVIEPGSFSKMLCIGNARRLSYMGSILTTMACLVAYEASRGGFYSDKAGGR